MHNYCVIAVDVGGTKILTILADQHGQVLAELKVPTAAVGQQVTEQVLHSIQAVLQQANVRWAALNAVAVGVPGQVDVNRRWVHFCPNLDWAELPLGQILEERLQVPVYIENDGNAATLGESVFGAGREARYQHLIYVSVGTGIGGGIIINGRIYHGTGSAGEFGHMTVMPDGPVCGCDNRGCLEALASGRAITTAARELVSKGQGDELLGAAGGQVEAIDVPAVIQAAKRGDAESKIILDGAARALGMGVANLINLFSPAAVILGGGVMKSREMFWPLLEKEVAARTLKAPLENTKIIPAALGGRAGAMGLVALALQQQR